MLNLLTLDGSFFRLFSDFRIAKHYSTIDFCTTESESVDQWKKLAFDLV